MRGHHKPLAQRKLHTKSAGVAEKKKWNRKSNREERIKKNGAK